MLYVFGLLALLCYVKIKFLSAKPDMAENVHYDVQTGTVSLQVDLSEAENSV